MAQKFLSHPIVKNALSLFTVQIARYILPLVTIPYLSRILGPHSWGLVIFAQVSAQWLGIMLDYGFNLSATREIARNRQDRQQVAEIIGSVMGASGLLLVASALIVLLMSQTIPVFKLYPNYLIWAWLIGIAQGIAPLWYFQAIEQMHLSAMLDLGTRVTATLVTFIWIKTSNEGWKVLAVQAIAGLITYGLMLVLMYRDIPWQLPRLTSSVAALRMGWNIFLSRFSVNLYTTANTFILGLLVPSSEVAFYGESDRISRAVAALSSPISQANFPRISYLLANNFQQAEKLASTSMIVMGIGSFICAGILEIGTPLIVHTLLGIKFEPVIPLLRIMVIIIPFVSLNSVLGIQWMIPLGLDRSFNLIIISVGIINLFLAPIFTHKFGSIAMAWAAVSSDILVTMMMYITLWHKDLSLHLWKALK